MKQRKIIFIIGIVIGLSGVGNILDYYQKERILEKEMTSLEKEQELIQETEVILETKELPYGNRQRYPIVKTFLIEKD